MFKRKKTEPDQPHEVTAVTAPAAVDAAGEPRTTCYPQGAEPAPAVVGEPRTTVYRQGLQWNRGGYDTTN